MTRKAGWSNRWDHTSVSFKNRIWVMGGYNPGVVNVSAYQSNAFAPNISVNWGYLFPQDTGGRRIRTGLRYYNGRALSNQFYNKKEKYFAFYVALDV